MKRFVRATRITTILMLAAGIFALLAHPARAQDNNSIDLSGPWLTHAGDDPHWGALVADETKWTTTTMPQPVAAPGISWYRKHFSVPADWASDKYVVDQKQILLHLGALKGACVVYINGYRVQVLGTMPTDSKGTGFVAAQAFDDIVAGIFTEAPTAGQSQLVKLVNFGADNVIALQVYTDAAGGGLTAPPLKLTKPSFADFYPYSKNVKSDDYLFDADHPIAFDVTFGNVTSDPVSVTYSVLATDDKGDVPPNYVASPKPVTVNAGEQVTLSDQITFATPGFYTLSNVATVKDTPLPNDSFVVGYDADKITGSIGKPADFDSYWNAVKQAASANPAGATQTAGPGTSTYQLEFAGVDGKSAYAWLSVPKGAAGKLPAILELPGYDLDYTAGDSALAAQGFVVMRFIATAPSAAAGNAGSSYFTTGIESQDTYVYKKIVENALRALAVLAARPEVNASRIGVIGADQGGALAYMLAALEPGRVKAAVVCDPTLTLNQHSLHAATMGPYIELKSYIAAHAADSAAIDKTLNYFDTINFAAMIKTPVSFDIGLQDHSSPPYSGYALANATVMSHRTHVDPTATDGGSLLSDGETWLSTQL